MIYVLVYSRTSKGLSLGELIRAFYIIIFIPYIILLECYLHCYISVLHVLEDLWDFHTKSLFLAFNIWEGTMAHVALSSSCTNTLLFILYQTPACFPTHCDLTSTKSRRSKFPTEIYSPAVYGSHGYVLVGSTFSTFHPHAIPASVPNRL